MPPKPREVASVASYMIFCRTRAGNRSEPPLVFFFLIFFFKKVNNQYNVPHPVHIYLWAAVPSHCAGSVKGSHTYFDDQGLKLGEELRGLRQGLKLAKERAWEGVELESDSLNAGNNLNSEEEVENHPERILIEDCRSLKRDINARIWNILREVNRCADKMAKLGVTHREQLV